MSLTTSSLRTLMVTAVIMIATASTAQAELRVVTTTTDLGDFARTIGGDRVKVDTICRGTQDPHYVQARPSYMLTLSRADLLLAVGLELEVGWLPALITGARNPDINPGRQGYLELADVVAPIDVPAGAVDRASGDIHPKGNPHFWLDPNNALLAAREITSRLSALDPDNAEFFEANFKAWSTRINRSMARWTKAMAPYRGTKIVSYHRTFNYFHQRFGLSPVGYIENRPGIPPSPAHLASLIRQIQKDSVATIFHEQYYDKAMSTMVGGRTSAEVLVLPTSVGGIPSVSNYEQLIDHIVATFTTAMERTRE